MAGRSVIRNARVIVDLILELLSMKLKDATRDHNVEIEDVYAALLYAAR